jgi:N-acyl-D-aspartate/D-glutamate deacylase
MSQRRVIRGGVVADGSGGAPQAGDVVVEGDRIAGIAPPGTAVDGDEIDAAGLVVAPGFVNVLSHAYYSLQLDPRGLSDLMQGVTTLVFGEGWSLGPCTEPMLRKAGRDAPAGVRAGWPRLAEALRALEADGLALNVASFVGAHNLRELSAGDTDRPLTRAEKDRACAILAEEMADGALGVGSALIYPPGCFADTRELAAWCDVVAQHDGLYISHMRSEGSRLLESLDELTGLAQATGVRAEVYHLKAAGQDNWPKMRTALDRIEQARARGLQVTADIYPYTAGMTSLSACIPPRYHDGGMAALLDRLADPGTRADIARDIVADSGTWENLYLAAGGAGGILLLGGLGAAGAPHLGATLAQAAAAEGADPVELLLDLVADAPQLLAAYFIIDEDNMRAALTRPWVAICSDSEAPASEGRFLATPTHPRAYGSFARVLGRYARDERLLPLPEAVRRMTALPARTLRLDRRGRIAPGYFADIAVFDPDTVADDATYDAPHRYARGVTHVLVNGVPEVRDARFSGATAGRALRRGTA